jgi:hypothetical protein
MFSMGSFSIFRYLPIKRPLARPASFPVADFPALWAEPILAVERLPAAAVACDDPGQFTDRREGRGRRTRQADARRAVPAIHA